MVRNIFFLYFFLLFSIYPSFVFAEVSEQPKKYCLSFSEKNQEVKYNHAFDRGLNSAVDRAGWKWVKPEWDGDKFPVDYVVSPNGEITKQLPELYRYPCSYWSALWGDCELAHGVFSEVTGVTFVEGHIKNLLGMRGPRSYGIFGDNIISMQSGKRRPTRYRGDIKSVRLAALQGENDELILYDGKQIKELVVEEAEIPFLGKGQTAWMISNTYFSNRSFIHSNGAASESFIYEVIEGPMLKKIKLNENIKGWIKIVDLPDDKQAWIITRHGVFLEDKYGFKRVAHFGSADYIIAGPAYVGLTQSENITFPLQNKENQKTAALLNKNLLECDFELDASHDTALVVD